MKKFLTFWWNNNWYVIVIGLFLFIFGIIGLIPGPLYGLWPTINNIHIALSPEFISIGFTILGIDSYHFFKKYCDNRDINSAFYKRFDLICFNIGFVFKTFIVSNDIPDYDSYSNIEKLRLINENFSTVESKKITINEITQHDFLKNLLPECNAIDQFATLLISINLDNDKVSKLLSLLRESTQINKIGNTLLEFNPIVTERIVTPGRRFYQIPSVKEEIRNKNLLLDLSPFLQLINILLEVNEIFD